MNEPITTYSRLKTSDGSFMCGFCLTKEHEGECKTPICGWHLNNKGDHMFLCVRDKGDCEDKSGKK